MTILTSKHEKLHELSKKETYILTRLSKHVQSTSDAGLKEFCSMMWSIERTNSEKYSIKHYYLLLDRIENLLSASKTNCMIDEITEGVLWLSKLLTVKLTLHYELSSEYAIDSPEDVTLLRYKYLFFIDTLQDDFIGCDECVKTLH